MQLNTKRNAKSSNQDKQPPKKKQKTHKQKHKRMSPWTSSQHCISWLLFNKQNISIHTFFKDYFGTKPLLIRRNNPNYYNQHQLKFELNDVYQIIKKNELKFGQHMICKSYDGNKEQIAPWIKSNDSVTITKFKKIMNKGYTVQFHHPQHFYHDIAKMIALLESSFGVEVGCNVYITPNKKQGLAPHWDDVEVFVLQIEGKKHWKLYERTEDDNKYPLQSSDSLDLSADCPDAKFLMEFDLNPGDLVYFPRGTIHCAKTVGKTHSTHLTISTHQRTTWGDFLHTLMDKALNEAIDTNIELRKNMPFNFISYMGSSFEYNGNDEMKEKQKVFMDKLRNIVDNVCVDSLKDVVHDVCDVIGADFVSNRIPPSFMLKGNKNGNNNNKDIEVHETTNVCLKCIDWIRVVDDEDDEELEEMPQNETESDGEEDEYMYKDTTKGFGVKMVEIASMRKEDDKVASFVDESEDDGDNDGEQEDVEEQFRLYSCVHNAADTHCVEFKDDPMDNKQSFIKLPMYLRPVVDALIHKYPKKQTVKELYDACSVDSIVTLPEIHEFIKLLYEMQLIKLSK